MSFVSIIIRTKNEAAALPACLDMIKKQTFHDFEIIIVDSGSTDQTLEIAKKFGCKIISIPSEKFTWGYSLNKGIESSRGDVIVHISAHCLPYDDRYLELLIKQFDLNSNLAGVYGRQIPFGNANPIERRGLLEAYPAKPEFYLSNIGLFSNAHCAILKSSWTKIQFDEKLSGSEDIDWVIKIKKLNYVIGYEPRSIVYHSHNESLTGIYQRFLRENLGLIKSNSALASNHTIFGYIARYFRSLFLDYLFLINNSYSVNYFFKWLILLPFYRVAVYYGQYKANK